MSKSGVTSDGSTAEFDRQYAVLDQSLSMHAWLRDRYEKRAFWLNTCQIGVSLFLCSLAFVGDHMFDAANLDAGRTRMLLGSIATLILLVSVTEFRVDWKSRAVKHDDAVKRLGALKTEYRKCRAKLREGRCDDMPRLDADYHRAMDRVPAIPEQYFARLKAAHQFKVVLSKKASENPLCPAWAMRVWLRWDGIRTEYGNRDGRR